MIEITKANKKTVTIPGELGDFIRIVKEKGATPSQIPGRVLAFVIPEKNGADFEMIELI